MSPLVLIILVMAFLYALWLFRNEIVNAWLEAKRVKKKLKGEK